VGCLTLGRQVGQQKARGGKLRVRVDSVGLSLPTSAEEVLRLLKPRHGWKKPGPQKGRTLSKEGNEHLTIGGSTRLARCHEE
jgi:hypothetical protein